MSGGNRILSLVALEGAPWRHPWGVRLRWNRKLEVWECNIKAGLVNCVDPTISIPGKQAPKRTVARLGRLAAEQAVDAWLTESPWFEVGPLRAIGPDSSPEGVSSNPDGSLNLTFEAVPEFFSYRGVGPPPAATFDPAGLGGQAVSGLLDKSGQGTRLLRACDLVLFIDRPSNSTQWDTGSGVDGLFAQFTVTTVEKPNAKERPYIRLTSKWEPPIDSAASDKLAGDWEGQPWDEYLIATVFLMSPPNAALDSPPDGSWSAFVKHSLFWNLHHGVSRLDPSLARLQLSLQTGLAGGVGDALGLFIQAQINDANSAASEFLGREEIQTHLWTV
ncbi:hypothetical protein [Verrucomicrobium spinosum]|uniref:hypothetical protein n=1 Tax=Verrucomicrobium spinosum TaxID=2736 RepID=UPI0001746887|nr:hypothetical protein [Verrucomicrobium spinosum]